MHTVRAKRGKEYERKFLKLPTAYLKVQYAFSYFVDEWKSLQINYSVRHSLFAVFGLGYYFKANHKYN